MITLSLVNPDTGLSDFWRTDALSVASWTAVTEAQRRSFSEAPSNLSQGSWHSGPQNPIWATPNNIRDNLCTITGNGKHGLGVFGDNLAEWTPPTPPRPAVVYNARPKPPSSSKVKTKTIKIPEGVTIIHDSVYYNAA